MGNELKTVYLPLRVSPGEIRGRLFPPIFIRFKARILKRVHHILAIKSYYTAENIPKYEIAGWPLFVVRHTILATDGHFSNVFISVEPWSRITSLFERMSDALENNHLEYDIIFSPPRNIEEEEILNIARTRLIFQIMRFRKFSIASLKIESKIEAIVYQPIWVCYYARTGKSLDVCLLDGYSGEKLGGQFRSAFLNAIASYQGKK